MHPTVALHLQYMVQFLQLGVAVIITVKITTINVLKKLMLFIHKKQMHRFKLNVCIGLDLVSWPLVSFFPCLISTLRGLKQRQEIFGKIGNEIPIRHSPR